MKNDPENVQVHIDDKDYESPKETTGAALYALGGVLDYRDLFRKEAGDDDLVPRDGTVIHVKKNEKFYSWKPITIVINGEQVDTVELKLSFEDLFKLAYPVPPTGENIHVTVDYGKGPKDNPKGSLKPGQSVPLKQGMVFDVVATDRS